jgi:hypothetical protein
VELEIIMLSEISQTNKDKYHMFFSYAESRALQKKKKKNDTSVKGSVCWWESERER